jgi:alcohol dehydrogenase
MTPRFPRLLTGVGTLRRVGRAAKSLGGHRALVVTDPGVEAAGHSARVVGHLELAGFEVALHAGVHSNPTTQDVLAALEVMNAFRPDLLVSVGGGSAMDTAKAANMLFTNGGEIADYRGRSTPATPLLPSIAIPTTAGTGSEVQSFALIADAETHRKMACAAPGAMPDIAILDPVLTLSLPREITAHTGLDALVHSVETAVCTARDAGSSALSTEAFVKIVTHLPRVLEDPEDLDARDAMLLGSMKAGMAIERSMLGAAHAMANPLTANHGIPHGLAVGMLIPHVIRFNAAERPAAAIYARLVRSAGLRRSRSHAVLAEHLADHIQELVRDCGKKTTLKEWGVAQSDVPALAEDAHTQWTAQFNPRPVDVAGFEALYAAATSL